MSQNSSLPLSLGDNWGKGSSQIFLELFVDQSLRVCWFAVVFWFFSLSNGNILDFAVSLSKVMVRKSDIHYLAHSSNAALEHRAEVCTISKELPIYINLQTDNCFEHQSMEVLLYLMQCTFYCLVGLQSLNKPSLLSWKKVVLNNNGSLIRKRQMSAWCHTESSLQSSVSSDTRGWCVFNFKSVLEQLTTLDPSARAPFVFYFLLFNIIIQLHWSKNSLYQSQCHLNQISNYCESQLL